MTKNEIVDLIWEWATEELEINKEKGLITCSKEQKEQFLKDLIEAEYSKDEIKAIKKEIENFYLCREELIEPYEIVNNGRGGIDFEDHPEDSYIIEVEYELKEVA